MASQGKYNFEKQRKFYHDASITYKNLIVPAHETSTGIVYHLPNRTTTNDRVLAKKVIREYWKALPKMRLTSPLGHRVPHC